MRTGWAAALAAIAIFRAPLFGAIVTFTVDPALSSLTVSGTFAGQPLKEQSPGSLTASYGGTIAADLASNGNALQILGGSITALDRQSESPSESLACYGFSVPFMLSPNFDIRNFSFSLSTAVITSPTAFNTTALSASVSAGFLDYLSTEETVFPGGNYLPYATSETLGGRLTFGSDEASAINSGAVGTLTIPVNASLQMDVDNNPFAGSQELDLHFSGTLVATTTTEQATNGASTPEPAAFVLFAIPTLAFFARRRRLCGKTPYFRRRELHSHAHTQHSITSACPEDKS